MLLPLLSHVLPWHLLLFQGAWPQLRRMFAALSSDNLERIAELMDGFKGTQQPREAVARRLAQLLLAPQHTDGSQRQPTSMSSSAQPEPEPAKDAAEEPSALEA